MTNITTPHSVSRGDIIHHLGSRFAVLGVQRPLGKWHGTTFYVQRLDGSEHRRSIRFGHDEPVTREVTA